MLVDILLVWLIVFFILLAVNVTANSLWFGIFAGLWLFMLSLAIMLTGVQIQSGMTITTVGDTQTISYVSQNLTNPLYPWGGVNSTYSIIWGVILICVSIFMIYSNSEKI